MPKGLRRGQAMVESVMAVLVISLVFFGLFYLSHLLTVKILLSHAAARSARMEGVKSVEPSSEQTISAVRGASASAAARTESRAAFSHGAEFQQGTITLAVGDGGLEDIQEGQGF